MKKLNIRLLFLSVMIVIITVLLSHSPNYSQQLGTPLGQPVVFLPLVKQPPPPPLILFASNRTGNEDIYLMNWNGTGLVNLTSHPAAEWNHQWSRDGQWITFLTNRDGNDEIYRLNRTGDGLFNLTQNPAKEWDYAWSPGGDKIAFLTYRDGNTELYVMNPNGTGITNLSNHAATERSFHWSPDGTKIAFTSNRDGDDEIFIINCDGTGLSQITHNNAIDDRPLWSPLGTQILFSSNVEKGGTDPRPDNPNRRDTYVIKPDGTNLTSLAYDTYLVHTENPTWFPDGQKVIFSAFWIGATGWPNEGFTVNIDGTNLSQFTNLDALSDLSFRFSPDGGKIALFHYNSDGYSGSGQSIYVIDADGTNLIPLQTNSNHNSFPVWRDNSYQLVFMTGFDVSNHPIQVSGGINIINADGTGFTRLTINEFVRDHSPLISPSINP